MAEFCLECWNKLNDTRDTESRYLVSRNIELCEGCARYKHVIVKERLIWRLREKVVKWMEGFKNGNIQCKEK